MSTISGQSETKKQGSPARPGLEEHGLNGRGEQHWQVSAPERVEQAVRDNEGNLGEGGALNAVTTPHTGRSPNDKFIVRDSTEGDIWWGVVNKAVESEQYDALRADLVSSLEGQDLYIRDMWAGADPTYRIGVRLITPSAWHN